MKILKSFIRVFLGLLLVFSISFTMFYGKNKITSKHSFEETEEYKGILTLWQIDSFEGGVGSRKQFLLKASRSFEKDYTGVLVMVIEHTEESMLEALKNNQTPDMISFGPGIKIDNFTELNLKTTSGGVIGERAYAVPWCRGGYSIILNPKFTTQIESNLDNVIISQSKYTQPLTALYLEGVKANNLKVKKPLDAYIEFVNGKCPYMIGTQRDIIRLERRGMEILSKPLEKFNDLYQYIAITSTDSTKCYYSKSFIEHLLSENVQKSLSEIGMFSTSLKVNYNNEHLSKMQNLDAFSTISAFTTAQELIEMQQNSLLLLNGRVELENKIKNMLV